MREIPSGDFQRSLRNFFFATHHHLCHPPTPSVKHSCVPSSQYDLHRLNKRMFLYCIAFPEVIRKCLSVHVRFHHDPSNHMGSPHQQYIAMYYIALQLQCLVLYCLFWSILVRFQLEPSHQVGSSHLRRLIDSTRLSLIFFLVVLI